MNTFATIVGYHGCKRSVAYDVFQGKYDLKPSVHNYDWLGNGIYFWENDPLRALSWAKNDKKISNEPFVIGAIIQCQNILDLSTVEATQYLELAYNNLKASWDKNGEKPKENKAFKDGDIDIKDRKLDCAVIDYLCETLFERTKIQIDAVISPFFEGAPVYPNAMFRKYTHTQIAVRNPDCILGYFLPKKFLKENKLM